ncbi:MAG: hypothetical protein KGM24_10145 [Elusimicrobia bacterium]|nr:hypothetical protein [Elusimicrobiota bacterium]
MILLLLLAAAPARAAAPAPDAPAAAVVRSKEWVVRRGKRPEEEFKGDVRYDAAGTHLSADWALHRRARRDWKARGRVVLRRVLADGTVVEADGETARYDERTRAGSLLPAPGGLVRLTRTPPAGEPDRGEGARLDWSGQDEATLSGAARVWGPRLALWADTARFERDGSRLTLDGGRPVLEKVEGEWTTALKADRVVATESPRRIEARGDVRGWLIFKDQARRLKELEKK